jgi:hypothetical protein
VGAFVFFILIIAAAGGWLFKNYYKPPPPLQPPSALGRTFAPSTVAMYAEFNPLEMGNSSSLSWALGLVADATLDWPAERARLAPLLTDAAAVLPWVGTQGVVAAGTDNKSNWLVGLAVTDTAGVKTFIEQKLRVPEAGAWQEVAYGAVALEVPGSASWPCYCLLPDHLVIASDRATLGNAIDVWFGKFPSFLSAPRWSSPDLTPHAALTLWVDGPYATAALIRLLGGDADSAESPLSSDRVKRFAAGLKSLTVEGLTEADGSFTLHAVAVPLEGSKEPLWAALHEAAPPATPGLAAWFPNDTMAMALGTTTLTYNLYQAWNGSGYRLAAPSPSPSPSPTPTGSAAETMEPVNTPSAEASSDVTTTPAQEFPPPAHTDNFMKGVGSDIAVVSTLFPTAHLDVESQFNDCCANLKAVAASIELFKVDHQSYPRELTELIPRYLVKLPVCPAGGTYQYQRSDDGTSYHLFCQGEAHRAAGLPANAPSFDAAEGLNAERPDLGFWEVFVRQPTMLLATLVDAKVGQAAVQGYATAESISTEEVNHDPTVTDFGGWIDVGWRKDLVVAGSGPALVPVRTLLDQAKPSSPSLGDRLSEARLTPGTVPVLIGYLDPTRFGIALEGALNPTPAVVTIEAFKTIHRAWLTVAPEGPDLVVWLTLKK